MAAKSNKDKDKGDSKGQKKDKKIYVVIAIGVLVVTLAVGLNYSLDQAKIAGKRYGQNLKQTQEQLETITSNLETKLSGYKNDKISKEEMLENTEKSITNLEDLLKEYDKLSPPKGFGSSFELFKRSAEAQLDSAKMLKKWLETEDEYYRVKSDELFQKSFEYETAAISSYKSAKKQNSKP